ncbi:hypothetical protein EDC96DRAFT_550361 [Choanephora cucurbitarum]|nr:hypothetical protein EDC96DRAFT_550361 [Choanephora cucurbitarum]
MVPAYISNNSIRDVVHSTENLADFCLNNLTHLIINTRIKVLFNRKQKSWSVVLVSTESNFCVGDYFKCVLMQPLVKPNHSKLIEFKAVLLFIMIVQYIVVLYTHCFPVIGLIECTATTAGIVAFRIVMASGPNNLLMMPRFPGQCLTLPTLLLPFCVSNKRSLIVLRYYTTARIPSIVRLIPPSIPSDAPSISAENKPHFYS